MTRARAVRRETRRSCLGRASSAGPGDWRRPWRVGLVAALACLLTACKTELYSNLPEREANEIVSVLGEAGIAASRTAGKGGVYTVSVDQETVVRAATLLAQRGLPRQNFESLGKIFDSNKMVSTPFEERARFMHAINQELSNSLTRIAGVVSARVHVMMPDVSPLERVKPLPRASVFIYHHADVSVREHVPVIKALVVNAVSGLAYDDVAVGLFPLAEAVATGATGAAPFVPRESPALVYGALAAALTLLLALIGRPLVRLLRGRTAASRSGA